VLWGAFLGGLLLNLMPCVLPVIALKIFGFTQQAGQDPKRVFKLGLAFTVGVFTFFLGLAAAVIGLKAAGSGLNWGFQFQNPWILVGLISAVFIFGLNLLGVFEITLASGTNAKLSQLSGQHGYGGAFLHGMFTTLLGTSCTAPYLGVTLGFAVSQPAPSVLLIFLTIASGMSLPYLILTANTSLLKFLPKPGMWMERLKQGMGFIMLAVAVWLLSVLGESRGIGALSGTCAYLLLLGVGCWLLGVLQTRLVALVLTIVLGGAGFHFFLREPLTQTPSQLKVDATGDWVPFSPERLAAERSAGRPVFLDFTADWCLNCKVNERLTLSKPEVMEAFKKAGVLLMKADWTNGDKTITAELNRFNRVGVPFYLLYPPNSGEPVIFPELLTPSMMIEALGKLPQSK
jgi:thiol:disulfide interchange protein